jgi:peptidoglycan hydrolase CwlO-like protein
MRSTTSTPTLRLARFAVLAAAATAIAALAVLLHSQPAGGQVTLTGQQALADRLRAAVAAETRRIAATQEGLATAQHRLAVLTARVQRRQAAAQQAQDDLIRARVRLTRLQAKAAQARKTLAANLLAQYKTPTTDIVSVAVEAHGFSDLLSQLRFLRAIADRNANILRDTRDARDAVQRQTVQLNRLRLRLNQLAQAASEDRQQADVLRNALLNRQATQLRHRAGAAAKLASVRARIASLQRQQAIAAQRAAQQQAATQQAPRPAAPGAGAPQVSGNDAVAKVVAAANQIATTPYVWGGGHGGTASGGYDCSGSLSYALAAAGLVSGPLTSGGFMSWGLPGPGRRITVYANAGHTFMIVDGRRFDTSALSGGGTRWTSAMRSTAGFVARHPPGL